MSNTSKQPAAKITMYPITAAIWRNEKDGKAFYSVTIQRSYKNADGDWKSSDSLNEGDLLLAAKVLDLAHTEISKLLRSTITRLSSRKDQSRIAYRGRALSRVSCLFSLPPETSGAAEMMRLTLQWQVLDKDHVALVFDKATWAAFHLTADTRGVDAGSMIVEALSNLLGPIAARSTNG